MSWWVPYSLLLNSWFTGLEGMEVREVSGAGAGNSSGGSVGEDFRQQWKTEAPSVYPNALHPGSHGAEKPVLVLVRMQVKPAA